MDLPTVLRISGGSHLCPCGTCLGCRSFIMAHIPRNSHTGVLPPLTGHGGNATDCRSSHVVAGTRLLLAESHVAPVSSGPVLISQHRTLNTRTTSWLAPPSSQTRPEALVLTPLPVSRSSTLMVGFTGQAACRVSGRSNGHDHLYPLVRTSGILNGIL